MLNKDKRSIALMMLLGDGNLHVDKRGYASLNLDHGITQSDYLSWKASLLSTCLGKDIKLRTGHKGKSVQISVSMKRFRAWYKFTYPNRKKDLAKVIKFIRQPELALAIWLMDDGYVEPSQDKRYPNALYGAILRIFTCDQTVETQNILIKWFKDIFDVEPRILYAKNKKQGKSYPFLKFNQKDSLKLWKILREFILNFKSMQHKFRYIEQIYQSRCLQPQAAIKADDIVKR
jgi:hypothetical protein